MEAETPHLIDVAFNLNVPRCAHFVHVEMESSDRPEIVMCVGILKRHVHTSMPVFNQSLMRPVNVQIGIV